MNEIEPLNANQEMAKLKARLENAPNGEYHIPGVKFIDQTPEVARLHVMMTQLSRNFPGYIWSTSDSIFPQNTGITVRWRKKNRVEPSRYGTQQTLPEG